MEYGQKQAINYIRSPDNRNKPGGDVNDMFTFNDFIREQCLTELPIWLLSMRWKFPPGIVNERLSDILSLSSRALLVFSIAIDKREIFLLQCLRAYLTALRVQYARPTTSRTTWLVFYHTALDSLLSKHSGKPIGEARLGPHPL